MSIGNQQPGGGGTGAGSSDGGGTNLWDALRAVAVIAAAVYLTVFLVRHYTKVQDAATILGIAAPVLAATVGISLGYYTGNAHGQARGEAGKHEAVRQARKDLASQLAPIASQLEPRTNSMVSQIMTTLRSAPGEDFYSLSGEPSRGGAGLSFDRDELTGTQEAVARLRGTIDAVMSE